MPNDGNWLYGHPDGTAADHAYHAATDAKKEAQNNATRIARLEERVIRLEQLVKVLIDGRL